jgi:hypothetical protein
MNPSTYIIRFLTWLCKFLIWNLCISALGCASLDLEPLH